MTCLKQVTIQYFRLVRSTNKSTGENIESSKNNQTKLLTCPSPKIITQLGQDPTTPTDAR